ncbi:unnamed protein product, partial [marine sediment metagenome]
MLKEKITFGSKRVFILIAAMAIIIPFFLISNISCGIIKGETGETEEAVELEEAEGIEDELIKGEELIESTVEITIWDCLGPKERLAFMESRDGFVSE